MTAIAQPTLSSFAVAAAWRRPLVALGLVVAVLLFAFRRDVADLATLYWTNTTFGHCLFIAPVIGWLV